MRLLRSEEHARRWAGDEHVELLTAVQICDLAHAWWGSRLDPGWAPRTREQSQAILDGLGLTGDFWQLA